MKDPYASISKVVDDDPYASISVPVVDQQANSAPVNQPKQDTRWFEPGSQSEAVARGLINGATLGTAPVVNAGINALGSAMGDLDYQKDFKQNLSDYETSDKSAGDKYPWTYGLSSVASGLPGAIATGGKSVLANMGVGGAMGAISGAGHYDPNQSVSDNAVNIGAETALDAAIPLGLHAVAKLATPFIRSGVNLWKNSRPATEQEMANAISQFKNSSDVPQPAIPVKHTADDMSGMPDKFQLLSDLYKRLNPTKYPEKAYPFDPDFIGNAGKTEQQYNDELQQEINKKIGSDPYGQRASAVDKNDNHFLNDISSNRYTRTTPGQESGLDSMTQNMNARAAAGQIGPVVADMTGKPTTHPFVQEDTVPNIFANEVAKNAGTLTNDEAKNVIEHYNTTNPPVNNRNSRMATGIMGLGGLGGGAAYLAHLLGTGDVSGVIPLLGAGAGALGGYVNDAHLPLRAEIPQIGQQFESTVNKSIYGTGASPSRQLVHEVSTSPSYFAGLRDYLSNNSTDNPQVEAKKQEMLNHLDQNGDDETQQRRAQMLGQSTAAGRAVTNSDSPLVK